MAIYELFGFTLDPRITNLPLINSPYLYLSVLVLYLATVLKWGPSFMKNRKAFDLKLIISMYNVGQVFACVYIIRGFLNAGFEIDDVIKCPEYDYSQSEESLETLRITYLTFLLKLAEFIETIFFVLRKKQNQVSNLHVFHHVSTVTLLYIATKHMGGAILRFPVIINSMVHIIMYTYYLFAQYKITEKLIKPLKKSLTIIQMIQFTIILIHIIYLYCKNCKIPIGVYMTYLPTVILVFYMFYEFYQNSYFKKINQNTKHN